MAMSRMKSGSGKSQGLKNISAIFFDLDNTLIATRKADAKACGKVVQTLIYFIIQN